jgi:hypothetical protein
MGVGVTRAPWWTPADAAEQAVIVRELVDWDFAHRDGCLTCDRDGCCAERRRRIEALIDWCDRRSGESLAAELRRLENLGLEQAAVP